MTNTIASAIARSVSHNETVTLTRSDLTEADLLDLTTESEDSADNGDVTEYWGTTESGSEWRVHVA